ncbi:MAG: competence/damage-inducible protein A [Hyphomicrobium sp.]
MIEEHPITAAALIIGDEILSGRTKDRNIGQIADHLTSIGIKLVEVRVVADDRDGIIEALNALRAKYTYVFTSGGIGPTHDDITAEAVACAFDEALEVNSEVAAQMKVAYEKKGLELNSARMRMARIPKGAKLVPNDLSVAPGFQIGNVIVMAGVPAILDGMLKEATKTLKKGQRTHSMGLVLDNAEGEIADLYAKHQTEWPSIQMGSYPSFKDGAYVTELVLRGHDPVTLQRASMALQVKLREHKFQFKSK